MSMADERGSEEDRGCEGDDRRAEHAGTIRRWLPFRVWRSALHVLEAGSGRRLLGTCFTALDTHALTVSTLLLADPHDDRHAPYLFPPPPPQSIPTKTTWSSQSKHGFSSSCPVSSPAQLSFFLF